MHGANGNGSTRGSRLHRDVAEFVAEGFTKNDPVVLISTLSTRQALEAELVLLGCQLFDLECQGRARWCDSHVVLARILVDGIPDEARFDETMAEILAFDGLRASRQRTRAYYDLVDVLRERGEHSAAIVLDRLWSDLCEREAELVLAYTAANLFREKDCAV
jgi:hypothetical protein